MVSITLSVPKETKERMNKFPEMNWSGFVRESIESKTDELQRREQLLKLAKAEQEDSEWFSSLVSKSRSKRVELLKKQGLI